MELGSLVGGLGLFLLGMHIMTPGLRNAAGHALPRMLHGWTRTPLRGVATGALITSLVQSSSAVTVATVGFVNAGLISISQASMVVYGANVGTTMTSWLVALLGFKVNLKLLALPLVGIGMLLRMGGGESRRTGFGEALAGFALFFLGIDVLVGTFGQIGEDMQLEVLTNSGLVPAVAAVAIGFAMTALTQSSSAATAVTLTATAGGLVSVDNAAAMVIGANLGTTSTAVLAALAATPNARRVASVHVLFNLVTGIVALALLPALLFVLRHGYELTGSEPAPATLLAMFHTVFNVLGVVIMLPLTGPMLKILARRFVSAEENEARPRFLDRNTLQTPLLAINALSMELERVGDRVRRMATSLISSEAPERAPLGRDRFIVESLVDACGTFIDELQRGRLPERIHDQLPNGLRITRYYMAIIDLLEDIVTAMEQGLTAELPESAAGVVNGFKIRVLNVLDTLDAGRTPIGVEEVDAEIRRLKSEYQLVKTKILQASVEGGISVRRVVRELEILSDMRRVAEQAIKAASYLSSLAQSGARAPADASATT